MTKEVTRKLRLAKHVFEAMLVIESSISKNLMPASDRGIIAGVKPRSGINGDAPCPTVYIQMARERALGNHKKLLT